jgi:peptide deformylase
MSNPVITWKRSGTSGIKEFREGCLSVPGKYIPVQRAQKVTCKYTDENGEFQEISESGWMSAIIQHELDHLDGICKVSE